MFVYRDDLAISIVMGRRHLEHYQEDWATNFADRTPRSGWIDFLYSGNLVYSDIMLPWTVVAADFRHSATPIRKSAAGITTSSDCFSTSAVAQDTTTMTTSLERAPCLPTRHGLGSETAGKEVYLHKGSQSLSTI